MPRPAPTPAPDPAVATVEVRPAPDKPSSNGPPASHTGPEASPASQSRLPGADDDEFLFEKPDSLAELDLDAPARPAAELNHAPHADTPPPAQPVAGPKSVPTAPPEPRGGSKLVAVVVDVAVVLILLVAGVLLGEVLARRPTREVLTDAGSAPKFPPIDLLMWMTPPVLLALVYALLASRGKTVGGWLRRSR